MRGTMRRFLGAASAALLAPVAGAAMLPPDNDAVIRIEEDWRIVLNEPGMEVSSPQFHTVMSPYGSLSGLYFQVTWNYRELPDFSQGGLQLQVWSGDENFATRDAGEGELSNDAETVTWTSVLETDGATVTFSVENGHSSSWGSFGGESMRVRTNKPVHSLGNYSTNISRSNSWIEFGSNRVTTMVITEVRAYGADGLLWTDSSQHTVFAIPNDDEEPAGGGSEE